MCDVDADLTKIEASMRALMTFDEVFSISPGGTVSRKRDIDRAGMEDVIRRMGCASHSRLLDVGCSGGRWIAVAVGMGIPCAGVEIDEKRARVASNVLGERARIIQGDLCRKEVWDWKPTDVISSDVSSPRAIQNRVVATMSRCPSVQCIVSFRATRPPPGFAEAGVVTLPTPDSRATIFRRTSQARDVKLP